MKRSAPPGLRARSGLVAAARAPIFARMCGRFTHRYTWADIHRLYRLTSPASNVQPSYNVCPTDTVNVVTSLPGRPHPSADALGPDPALVVEAA
jgi:hypothetical protein